MASAKEIDFDPNAYVGLSFPLRRSATSDFEQTKNTLEAAKHNIKNLLLTHIGERVGQPEFGSNLRAICFEQINDELPTKVDEEVRKSINTWLPYIIVESINTLTEDGDENRIIVEIQFSTSLNPESIEQIRVDASYTAERV